VPERKLGFFVKIKPPARRAYAPEGHVKKITTPVRSAGPVPVFSRGPTGQAVIQVVFRGLKFESDPREIGSAFHGSGADIGGRDSFRSGTI